MRENDNADINKEYARRREEHTYVQATLNKGPILLPFLLCIVIQSASSTDNPLSLHSLAPTTHPSACIGLSLVRVSVVLHLEYCQLVAENEHHND